MAEVFGPDRLPVGTTIRGGVINVLALAPAVIARSVIQRPLYPDSLPPQIAIVRVPRRALTYGVLVWPVLRVTTEEVVYLGYVPPRLRAQLGRRLPAAVLVALVWGPIQHVVLPALPDRRYVVCRALTALPLTATQTAIISHQKRHVVPLIIGHWVANLATAITTAVHVKRAGTIQTGFC